MRIVVLQKWGLGNQLFQYAAGLFFAKKYGGTLEVIREPERYAISNGHPRPFLLSHFSISAPVRERNQWDRLMCSVSRRKRPLVVAARFASRTEVWSQPLRESWTSLPALPIRPSTRNVYLEGRFQAFHFAQDIEPAIRTEFSFRNSANGKNLDVMKQIQAAENPVSLHVRRGDYALRTDGQCVLSPHYYARAMQTIRQRVANPTFFVFSDEIAFAQENLPSGYQIQFMDHNDEGNPHEDLRLMSACHHHIIANSTLSWWGAWLNPSADKLVCAPTDWQNGAPNLSYPDIIPPGWLRIATDASSA